MTKTLPPIKQFRISNPFARAGSYASHADDHGPAGHHTGTDFAAAWPLPILGRRVLSCTPGWVVINGYNSTMGNWVGIWYAEDDVTITYWHLSRRRPLPLGSWVPRGKVLGTVGSTGNSTGPHCHIQVNHGCGFNYHAHTDPSPWVSTRPQPKRWRRTRRRAN